uniref:AlNc14C1167G12818 protein n=1 Tax=Albugo laibachii Nc14 TaxID=890382 RepID=F0X2K0_9STRA|nr:AlNc14C1167G12818 [Albugo laibachii Nc14]|eukprot:CCA28105.1 AlNc14C1167G12818 [Albugo laibachii Nc14]
MCLWFQGWSGVFCAIHSNSIQITFTVATSEDRQKCLLEYAGAIHIEEIKTLREETTGKLTYWAVGAPKFFTSNLIHCIAYNNFLGFDFVKTNAIIATGGISGELSPQSFHHKSNEVEPTYMEQLSVNSYSSQKERETGMQSNSGTEHNSMFSPDSSMHTQLPIPKYQGL